MAADSKDDIIEADCFAGKSSQVCEACARELRTYVDEDAEEPEQ